MNDMSNDSHLQKVLKFCSNQSTWKKKLFLLEKIALKKDWAGRGFKNLIFKAFNYVIYICYYIYPKINWLIF